MLCVGRVRITGSLCQCATTQIRLKAFENLYWLFLHARLTHLAIQLLYERFLRVSSWRARLRWFKATC